MTEGTPRCRLCGRLLRDETSRAVLAGPVCRRKLGGHTAPRIHRPAHTTPAAHIPGQLAIPVQPELPTG
ncbi:DUF6011 domain-containing protein [Streptomyces sp. NPDC004610]|uniref:DUF6011 domain-containing protein n=1 Tax=unclassified Streptomyces TaxID=2593676 RepID=UPI0033B0F034